MEGHSELFCTWRQEGKCHCHTDEEVVVAKPFDVQITSFCSALPTRWLAGLPHRAHLKQQH